ncbi:hypothetical protein OCK02_19480 [Rhizobium sp. TRM96647]|uniref:hypothetical protein n=1 Tax=unclassified Rhizobium TaxID=2613769 RepID=UPI0021E83AA6|nr:MULTISPECIES: hypothetical protein [unclassified Rhizobium]MCV3738392.1 hypothetical protein [Rhizobium sp. TRM96647]MCV3759859.1 hypothetical protein [Rhizobium sp. TRM96650]
MRFDLRDDLPTLKAKLQADIDRSAGEIRLLFITDAPGQGMIYQEKRREAEALLADPDLPPEQTPHLTAEAAAFDMTRAEKATEILAQAVAWTTVSATIETRRLAAKASVQAATSAIAARTAAAVDWSDVAAAAA